MAKTLVGALRVTLGLDSTEFATGVARVQGMTQRLSKQLALIGTAVSAAGAGIAVAVRKQINAADDMGEAAQKFGVPVEELSAMAYVGKIVGVQFEAMATGLRTLSRNMAQSPQKFEQLGVAVRDVNGALRPTTEVIKDLADKFQTMPDGAEKTALAMQLFGKSGADMILMLNEGSSGITKLMDEAKAMGLVISEETARAAGKFNENLDKLAATATGLAAIVAAQLAPVLEQISGYVLRAAGAFQNLSPELQKFIAWGAGIVVVLGPVLITLGLIVGALGAILTPVTAVIAAGVALGVAWYNLLPTMAELQKFWNDLGVIIGFVGDKITEFISGAIAGLTQAFNDLWTRAIEIWEGIKSTIGGAIDSVTQKWDTFVGKLQGAIQVARDVGTAISEALNVGGAGGAVTDGLVNGMLTGQTNAASAGAALGAAAAKGIAEALGIQSPSRVAAGYGVNVAEGLAQGIVEGKSLVAQAAQSLSDTAAGAMKGIGDLGDKVGDMFATAATNVLTGVTSLREAVGQLLQQLAQLLINSAMKQLFGNLFDGLNLGGYATGTFSAASGLAMVGEQGPELVNLRGGERIMNAPATRRMLAPGAAQAQSAQVTSNIYLDGKLILSKLDSAEGEAAITTVLSRLGVVG